MARIVSLLELQLPSSNTLYEGTSEGVEDASANVYTGRLVSHPRIRRELSDGFFGIEEDGSVTAEIASLEQPAGVTGAVASANELRTLFRSIEPRDSLAILRRKNLDTGVVTDRFSGKIDRVDFSQDGAISVEITGVFSEKLSTPYPRIVVDDTRFPTATDEKFARDLPIPLHVGAHREHTPARYVEEDFTLDRYRYVLGLDLKRSTSVWSQIRPFPNTLYIGVQDGARVIPAGEYDPCWNPLLSAVDDGDWAGSQPAGGTLAADTYYYNIGVVTTSGQEIIGSTWTATLISPNFKNVFTADTVAKRRRNAAAYRLYRNLTSAATPGNFLYEAPAGSTTVLADDGSYTEDTSRTATAGSDGTGQHTAEVLFSVPQYLQNSALSPILSDMEYTELAPDDDADGLWLFRGDMRDECSHALNWLHDEDTKFLFLFDKPEDGTAGTDRTGTQTPVHQGTPVFARGQRGKSCWSAGGDGTDRWVDATATGLQFDATTDFRVDVRVKPAAGTDARMTLVSVVSKAGGSYGWRLDVSEEGQVLATLFDGSTTPTATGTTKLVGNAWHTVSLIVNRTADTLVVEVDGNVEATTDITGLGTLVGGTDIQLSVGALSGYTVDLYQGIMEFVSIKEGTLLGPFVNGKAGSGANALDLTGNGKPQYVTDAAAVGLELATEDITLEAWVYLAGANAKNFIISKSDDATKGYQLRTTGGVAPKPTIVMTGQSGADLQHSTTMTPSVWHYIAGGREGSTVWIALDGIKEVSGATSAVDMSNAHDVTIGALNPAGTSKWVGYIDEARISVGTTRTVDQLKEAYYLGMRNPVRQVQQILSSAAHGPGLTCDATTCDAAALAVGAVGSGALVADYALVEQQELRLHLRELLKLRGIRASLTSAGTVALTADTQQASSATFGFQDGQYNNMAARPTWFSPLSLNEMKRNLLVRYRRIRTDTGDDDRFVLRSSERVVFTIGDDDEPLKIDAPAIRDVTHADRYAYYRQQRGMLDDAGCSFRAGEDADGVSLGDVLTLLDPGSGIATEDHEVRVLEEAGGEFQIETRKWASAIYGYSAGTLPTEPAAESTADFGSTPPPAVSSLSAAFALTEATDGTTHWTATITWVNPTGVNFKHVAVAYAKGAAGVVWQEVATELAAATLVVDGVQFEESTTYRFRVTTINQFGVRGLPVIFNVATTLPGAPSQVTGVAAVTAGHRTRRWKWTRSPRSENVDHYEYEVDTTDPISTALESGEVRNPRLSYTEADLTKTDDRYARVRAINANGTAGTWSSVVLNTGNDPIEGDAGVGDIDPASVDSNDIADVAVGNPHLALTGSKVLTGTHADIVSSTNTFNVDTGSRVLVILTGLVEFSDGAVASGDAVVFKLLRGATEAIAEETLAGGGMNVNASQTATFPFSFLFVDTVLRSGSTTWKMQAKKIGTPGVTTLYNVRISVVELSR